MCAFKTFGDLHRDTERLIGRYSAFFDAVGERRSLDELHDECRRAVRFLEPIDVGDVRMIERRQQFGLALEASQTLCVGRKRLWQDFDGNVALEIRVCRPIHHAHATGTDLISDFVWTKAGARGKRHC